MKSHISSPVGDGTKCPQQLNNPEPRLNQWTGSGREVEVHCGWTLPSAAQKNKWHRTRAILKKIFFPDSGRHQNEAFDVIFPSEKEMIFVRINCICLTLIVTSKSTGEIQFYDIERESDVHENEPNYYFF